jgi:hypothetical protein
MWHLAGAIVASNEEGVRLDNYFDGDGNKLSSFAGGGGWFVGYCNSGVCSGAAQEYDYQTYYPYHKILGTQY